MQIEFLNLAPAERAIYFQQAALKQSTLPVIVEKDFWVCWLLGVLFSDVELARQIVFKGGTSLSKVFGVIDRFSEDIDLSIAPEFVGIDDDAIVAANTRTQRDRLMLRLEQSCLKAVRERIQPAIEPRITAVLGPSPRGRPWLEFEVDGATHSPVLLFQYPSSEPHGFSYLRRFVKLEFGSLTDQQPIGRFPVRPWVADAYPDGFTDWKCEVVALELARTFWEKATILHAEFHRDASDKMPDRFSRHYADMSRLAQHPSCAAFFAMDDLCGRVVEWKSRFFSRAWARYDLARRGTFRLVPPTERFTELSADYDEMRQMFISLPPAFDEIVRVLEDAEQKINRPSP